MLHINKLQAAEINFFPKKTKALLAILFTTMGVFSLSHTTAQTVLSGKVVDAKNGHLMPGVSITEKGYYSATASDAEGKFSIRVKKLPATLEFSSIGYETKKIIVMDASKILLVQLDPSAKALDEVVVVNNSGDVDAYYRFTASTQKKEAPVHTDLAGKASGLIIKRSSPSLSSTPIKVRGVIPIETEDIKASSPSPYDHLLSTAEPAPAHNSLIREVKTTKRSNLLTAGEVNDFKKWTMWEDYNETDFKIHSEKWSLYATQRYSVQLQNNDFRAVTGQKVYLINTSNGDTLWTAVSDNTGKAELWKGFSKTCKENNLVIAVQQETKQFAAIPFTQGINRIVLNRACTVSNKVEIAFVVDATGSMQDEIDYLKEELEDILIKISVKDPALDLHTGAVFYRDKTDEYVTRIQPLTAGTGNTVGFIKKQFATGGGDYPEALKEALEDAIQKLNWSANARTKIIFLLMDAPPHEEAAIEMATLISKAASQGIRIVPVACSGTDKATEFIMRSIALATNGTYLFLTDDSGIGNSHIKPTTDEFKVELLNDLLQRTIEQMCYTNTCTEKTNGKEPLGIYTNSEKISIFPNPTNGAVTLETNKTLKELYVADFTGKLLLRIAVKDKQNKYIVDLSAFPSATYFIRYSTNDKRTGAEKVILVR